MIKFSVSYKGKLFKCLLKWEEVEKVVDNPVIAPSTEKPLACCCISLASPESSSVSSLPLEGYHVLYSSWVPCNLGPCVP